jgi:effector-binding domain-containing protein
MNKSVFILKSISNKNLTKSIWKVNYSQLPSHDQIKCHFHLISKLNGGHSYKILKKLSLNIEIREYEASIWIFKRQNFNSINGIPFYVCQQYPQLIDNIYRLSLKKLADGSGLTMEAFLKEYNNFIKTKFEINDVTIKEIPRMTVASVRFNNVIDEFQDYYKYRKMIIQELENLGELGDYDLENLISCNFYLSFPFMSYHEVLIRKIQL